MTVITKQMLNLFQQVHKFNVAMACSGCSNAVNKALSRVEGVSKVDISLEKQTVEVEVTHATQEQVYEAIQKTGKKVEKL